MNQPQIALELQGLSKHFGGLIAVDGVNLAVQPGEFVTLLGPSGSGKTTTLRMIAGFTTPSQGRVVVQGEDITRMPPYLRDVGMVFQNYALFPHMTAYENVAFPLKMRRLGGKELAVQVEEALNLVELSAFSSRYPRQLSGGQQQRVALARAFVSRPRLLLMDEPLGALDKRLRETLQLEILRISKQLGATVIYVTHDQEEALGLSDRIAVFNEGRIVQVGSGEELYRSPESLFVADFLGESNILRGTLASLEGSPAINFGGNLLALPASSNVSIRGESAALVIRPEDLEIVPDTDEETGYNVLSADVREILYLGPTWRLQLRLDGGKDVVLRTGKKQLNMPGAGERVQVRWRIDQAVVVPDDRYLKDSRGAIPLLLSS